MNQKQTLMYRLPHIGRHVDQCFLYSVNRKRESQLAGTAPGTEGTPFEDVGHLVIFIPGTPVLIKVRPWPSVDASTHAGSTSCCTATNSLQGDSYWHSKIRPKDSHSQSADSDITTNHQPPNKEQPQAREPNARKKFRASYLVGRISSESRERDTSPSPRRTNTDCCQAVPRGHKPPLSLAATHSSSQGNRVSPMPMAGEVSNTSWRTPRSVQTEESTLSQQPFVKSTTRANRTSHTGRRLS